MLKTLLIVTTLLLSTGSIALPKPVDISPCLPKEKGVTYKPILAFRDTNAAQSSNTRRPLAYYLIARIHKQGWKHPELLLIQRVGCKHAQVSTEKGFEEYVPWDGAIAMHKAALKLEAENERLTKRLYPQGVPGDLDANVILDQDSDGAKHQCLLPAAMVEAMRQTSKPLHGCKAKPRIKPVWKL